MIPGASVSSGGPLYGGDGNGYGYDAAVDDDEYVAKDGSLFGSIRGGGARVKLMQVCGMGMYFKWDNSANVSSCSASFLTYPAISCLMLCNM